MSAFATLVRSLSMAGALALLLALAGPVPFAWAQEDETSGGGLIQLVIAYTDVSTNMKIMKETVAQGIGNEKQMVMAKTRYAAAATKQAILRRLVELELKVARTRSEELQSLYKAGAGAPTPQKSAVLEAEVRVEVLATLLKQ